MDNENNEQSRITLSIAFIATYLTLIFGFSERIKISEFGFNFWNDIVSGIFVAWGVFIALIFFLYLVFTALKLDYHDIKRAPFLPELTVEKINDIRKKLYDFGISMIFSSFAFPVYYVVGTIYMAYNIWIALMLSSLFTFLVSALLFKTFDSKK